MTYALSHRQRTVSMLFVWICISAMVYGKDYSISGKVVDTEGKAVEKTTILLLNNEGVEVQRGATKGGLGKGKFKFKDVLSGDYVLEIDAAGKGTANVPVTVDEKDVEDLEISLVKEVVEKAEAEGKMPPEVKAALETPDQNYVLNELSFEIKKLTAEFKHLNSEVEELKTLSKMWVNPLAIYSKEIILKNGSTVFGKIVYQDEESLKVETLVGYLIIDRGQVVRIVDNVITEEQQEYVPEQVRDSYTPPPMPKLAEPRYTSSTPSDRDAGKKFSANCVLVGNINERKDTRGNIIFEGELKNIGGRRADFVKIDFVFRKNWSGETKTLTTFIRGTYNTFDSGIVSDASLLPGSVGSFELYVPHDFGSFIGYSYVIDWEEYN